MSKVRFYTTCPNIYFTSIELDGKKINDYEGLMPYKLPFTSIEPDDKEKNYSEVLIPSKLPFTRNIHVTLKKSGECHSSKSEIQVANIYNSSQSFQPEQKQWHNLEVENDGNTIEASSQQNS